MMTGGVRGLYVMACNPAVEFGFSKPEFLVVQDLFLTETAKIADVVLPAQSFAERDGTFTNTERRVQLFRAALKPIGESKSDWWIITEIAKRLGAEWRYGKSKEIMAEIAATVPLYAGITYDVLAENVWTPRPEYGLGNPSHQPTEIAMGELENISSGKQWLSVAERDPQAKFDLVWTEPSPQSPVISKQFILAAARSLYDRGTLVGKSKIVQPRIPASYVELNSQDAEELGIENGAPVRVVFDACFVEVNARVNGHVPPGVVMIPNYLERTTGLPTGARVSIVKI